MKQGMTKQGGASQDAHNRPAHVRAGQGMAERSQNHSFKLPLNTGLGNSGSRSIQTLCSQYNSPPNKLAVLVPDATEQYANELIVSREVIARRAATPW